MYQVISAVGLLQISYQLYNFGDYGRRYYLNKRQPLKDLYPQKYALITGATQGLGYGYAEELAERGYNIIIASRNEEQMQNTIKQLKEKYNNIEVTSHKLDLGNTNVFSYEQFFQTLKEKYNDQICIFINNAAAFETDYFFNLHMPSKGLQVINANITGTSLFIQQILKYIAFVKQKEQNTLIVNVGSQTAKRQPSLDTKALAYFATKQYLNGLTEGLQQQYKEVFPQLKIINNAPGYIDSPMLYQFQPGVKSSFFSFYIDGPKQIAKECLDQANTNVQVVNGTSKQAAVNALLGFKYKVQDFLFLEKKGKVL